MPSERWDGGCLSQAGSRARLPCRDWAPVAGALALQRGLECSRLGWEALPQPCLPLSALPSLFNFS